MRVKALRNLILFNGKQLFKDKEYDLEDYIGLDLFSAGYVVKIEDKIEEVVEEVKKPRKTKKAKVGDDKC